MQTKTTMLALLGNILRNSESGKGRNGSLTWMFLLLIL